MATDTRNPQDNWATFRRILEQLIENIETQTELLKALLEEGDYADHLDFVQQLSADHLAIVTDESDVVDAPKYQRVNGSAEKPNAWKRWSDEDNIELRALVKYGFTDRQIGELMGRSMQAVREARYKIGLKKGL